MAITFMISETAEITTVEYQIFGKPIRSTVHVKCRVTGRKKAASSRREIMSWKSAASGERSAAPDAGWRKASKEQANCAGKDSMAQTPT